jgi:hypothetical protein
MGPQPMSSRRWIAIVVAVAAVSGSGCSASGGKGARPVAPERPTDAPTVILDADEFGALVLDGPRRTYLGVRRDTGVVWRDRAASDGASATCVTRCPDAVISSNIDSRNSIEVADPQPRLVLAGHFQPLTAAQGHKRHVLTAAGPDDFVLGAGNVSAGWWLEVHAPGLPVTRIPVGGPRTSWQDSASGRSALAITAVYGADSEARWFERTAAGWRPVGSVARVAGFHSCVSPDGGHALLLAQRPALLDRTGTLTPVTDLVGGSVCAFAGTGGLVGELSQEIGTGGTASRARLRGFDRAGTTRWSRDGRSVGSVAGDSTSVLAAYVTEGTLYEVDIRDGTVIRTFPGVLAAHYTGDGTLVVVRVDGNLSWIL